jgi:hypothetical protein
MTYPEQLVRIMREGLTQYGVGDPSPRDAIWTGRARLRRRPLQVAGGSDTQLVAGFYCQSSLGKLPIAGAVDIEGLAH